MTVLENGGIGKWKALAVGRWSRTLQQYTEDTVALSLPQQVNRSRVVVFQKPPW